MKKVMIQEDIQLVESKLKEFETKTGAELLLIVAESSDPYPGASWRFGVIGGFFISLCFSYFYDFEHTYYWPVSCLITILFMTWIGHFNWAKRFALSDWEIERETREKALEYFHTLGTSQVEHKVTAMIMASILEHKIIVMVDEALKKKINQAELDELVSLMQIHFKRGDMPSGFTQSIQSLEKKILTNFNGKVSDAPPTELQDRIIFI